MIDAAKALAFVAISVVVAVMDWAAGADRRG